MSHDVPRVYPTHCPMLAIANLRTVSTMQSTSIAAVSHAALTGNQVAEFLGVSVPSAIEPVIIARLRPYRGNARTHSKKQIRQIADSIRKFGSTNPVLIGEDGEIIAGHGRVEAAKLLGLDSIPTVRLAHLNAAQRRAYVLADNKLALNAGWDREVLAIELQGLIDLQFDVEIAGFSLAEVELVLDEARDSSPDPHDSPEDQIPPLADAGRA